MRGVRGHVYAFQTVISRSQASVGVGCLTFRERVTADIKEGEPRESRRQPRVSDGRTLRGPGNRQRRTFRGPAN